MDATLEVMLSFREAGDVHAAALKDSRPRNLNARKPAGAFRSRSRRGSIQLADEAAAKLFLSPKTIEYHLRSVYSKLGIRSRTALTTALGDQVHSAADAP